MRHYVKVTDDDADSSSMDDDSGDGLNDLSISNDASFSLPNRALFSRALILQRFLLFSSFRSI